MDDLPGLEPAKGIPGIDFVLKSADNEGNYVVDEVIKMGEKSPINDYDHDHVPVLDGDIIGDQVAVGCDICPVGWFIPIDEAEKLFNTTLVRS
jgi:hypothetical protein